jgi:hypothetical protein
MHLPQHPWALVVWDSVLRADRVLVAFEQVGFAMLELFFWLSAPKEIHLFSSFSCPHGKTLPV